MSIAAFVLLFIKCALAVLSGESWLCYCFVKTTCTTAVCCVMQRKAPNNCLRVPCKASYHIRSFFLLYFCSELKSSKCLFLHYAQFCLKSADEGGGSIYQKTAFSIVWYKNISLDRLQTLWTQSMDLKPCPNWLLRPIILLDWLLVFQFIGVFHFLGQSDLFISSQWINGI